MSAGLQSLVPAGAGEPRMSALWRSLIGLVLCWGTALYPAWARTWTAGPEDFAAQIRRLEPGDVLVLQPGVYRSTLTLRHLKGTSDAPITIRGDAARGRVIFRGSDVLKGWVRQDGDLFMHPIATEPSMVFINGQSLRQMGGTVFDGYPADSESPYARLHVSEGGIWPGRRAIRSVDELPYEAFYFDVRTHRLYLRTRQSPEAQTVEVSQRPHGLFASDVSHIVIEDLDIEHANTSVTGRGGALVVWGDDVVLRRVAARWNDLGGIQVGGDHNVVQDAQAIYNGQMGVTARGRFNRFERVVANDNNWRGFNKWWEAGGFKFIGEQDAALQDSQVVDCQALRNQGDGIWLDWKNARVEVARNVSAYNTGFGIHYEVSSAGLIHDNVVMGNGQRGIYLSSSDHTRVFNNLVLGNGLEGIVSIWDRDRADERGKRFAGDGNVIEANVIAYNREGALTLPAGASAVADRNVYWGEGAASRFSIGFPSPANPPSYGLQAWAARSAQDRRSWWVNKPMPAAWKTYLSQQSLSLSPLASLVVQSRAQPAAEGVVLGPAWSASGSVTSISDAGPSQLGSDK
ncbi:MAG TPA: right-handed parallel beta-helix repeat-containing protein [Aquabacterium sp.]|nr:right-handed parallel beta-helix repeat-containing protein [Aquabacterium sp.]